MLKGKKSSTQQEWEYVYNNYDKVVPKERMMRLVETTVNEIKSIGAGKKMAYAFSGGKDSIALQIVCELAGIKRGFMAVNGLYFTQTLNWFREHKPEGVEIIDTGEDIDWLIKHQEYLFVKGVPQKGKKVIHDWNIRTHLKVQKAYCKENNIDILMMGKRSQDGNWVPKDVVYDKGDYGVYCPLRNWKHEEIIACIRYFGKELSPFYFTKRGFEYGDTKFAIFHGENEYELWDYIYSIEPEIVVKCAKGITSAKKFLILKNGVQQK